MTEKELSQLFFLNRECERLQKNIDEYRQKIGYKSPLLSDMPKGGAGRDYTDDVAELLDLEAIQNANLRRIQRERARIEKYIGEVEDAEIRLIMRLRHINGMKWREIGAEMYMSHMTVQRKYRQFLKDVPNVPR